MQEAHLNQLEFHLADARALSLAEVFGKLETHRHSLHIQEYSLSRTSLDRVSEVF